MKTDILFISPGSSLENYQLLSNKYSAIEPPTWALLLAESCRASNFNPKILDINAEGLSKSEIIQRIEEISPRLICLVVYGPNVNAGTANMIGASQTAKIIKESNIRTPVCIIGSYVQAVPSKCIEEEKNIDFGFTNEGVYALKNILSLQSIDINNLELIDGVVWRKNNEIIINKAEKLVPQSRMDIDLPGYAWDLLPFKNKPFDLYRSPMWHAEYNEDYRSPYAAIQTSLGCQFGCNFCMINILNRNNEDSIGIASNYSLMRYWSPEFIIKEFDKLFNFGVRTIKITDEMFLLNRKYYVPLCEKLRDKGYGNELRMWAYSRIDTVRNPELLQLVRSAGIKWLALGIESGSKKIRLEVDKGRFEDVDIETVIKQIHDADINVMGNYIFGLPGDTLETMRQTLDLSKLLCTTGWNAYAAMALPGSQLYADAIKNNITLPNSYDGYSFHSYNTLPLPTKTLKASDVLEFRDNAFIEYHSDPRFLNKIKTQFGVNACKSIESMLKIKLRRKILENK